MVATTKSLSNHLGKAEQAIVLKTGKTIDSALVINRDGKQVKLSNILAQSTNSVSSAGKNLVAFAVGDTISTTKNGSVELAISGYSKLNLSPLASVRISDAGKDFLTYENLSGKVKYEFSKHEDGSFAYKVKGKTGYATIR